MLPINSELYLVDDDAAAREGVAALVGTLGLNVQEFSSAEEFLGVYQGHRPACVVADLRMRGMSGLELIGEMRTRGFTVPVILLTAHADTPTIVQAMQAGAFTALDKPCRESELWNTIREALMADVQRSEEDRVRNEIRARLESLTPSECSVLLRLLAGDGNKQVAHLLSLSIRTVEARKQSIVQKMQVTSIAELVQLVMVAAPELMPKEPN